MSARGYVNIHTTHDKALLSTGYVQEYIYEASRGVITLEEVNWLDSERLVAEAPEVGWIAYCGADTSAANVAIVHLPNRATVSYLDHVDDEVVVSANQIQAIGWEDYLSVNPGLRDYFEMQDQLEEN